MQSVDHDEFISTNRFLLCGQFEREKQNKKKKYHAFATQKCLYRPLMIANIMYKKNRQLCQQKQQHQK